MANFVFLTLILGIAVVGALILVAIGVAVYIRRKNLRKEELSPEQAAEITSTWNSLNH